MANPTQQALAILTGLQAQLQSMTLPPVPVLDTASSKKGDLLYLPAEVRVMIFKLVVVSPKPLSALICADCRPVVTDDGDLVKRNVSRRLPSEPALAATSKTIRNEVLPLFYEKNSFIFNPTVRSLPFADWYERLPRLDNIGFGLPLYHITTVILTKRTVACRRSATGAPHSHSYRITIKQQPGKDLSVQLGGAALGQCTCAMLEAYLLWCENSSCRKEKQHVTGVAKDIEWIELRNLQTTHCLHAAEIQVCGICGLPKPWLEPFGHCLLKMRKKTYASQEESQCATA